MDIRQQMTDKLIELIETGSLTNEQLWDIASVGGLPVNYQTKRRYNGINVLALSLEAHKKKFETNEWLTFKQAKAMGATVRKGAKGTLGVYYKLIERKADEGGNENAPVRKPMLSPFWVFNVQDIEGLPTVPVAAKVAFSPIEEAERMLQQSKAVITWRGSEAAYNFTTDEIYLPSRDRFSSAANAYATALHELTHWTGHSSRLNREFSRLAEVYAFEELVAELGSSFLMAHLGIKDFKLENHASYLEHYLRIMKADKSAIFTAARYAGQAFDYILKITDSPADDCAQAD